MGHPLILVVPFADGHHCACDLTFDALNMDIIAHMTSLYDALNKDIIAYVTSHYDALKRQDHRCLI